MSFRMALVRHCALAFFALLFTGETVWSHPHVWVTVTSELVYDGDGSIAGLRSTWTFDDMFSAFAVQGLPAKQDGVFTRSDLTQVTEVNVSALKTNGFFTHAKLDGKPVEFADPVNSWSEYKDQRLVLHFTLPLRATTKARSIEVDVTDLSEYVAFSLSPEQPFTVVGSASACEVTILKFTTIAQVQCP